MSGPLTDAGKRLLENGDAYTYTRAVLAEQIAAIEAEKEAEVRARLADEVADAVYAALADPDHAEQCRPNGVLAEAECITAAVLDLIQPEGAKA